MKKIRLGIIGVGKIVQDQHFPAITQSPDFEILATASPKGSLPGIPAYLSIEEMFAATPEIEAVALCMPPRYRFAAAALALNRGLHVLLEKPPCASVAEVESLIDLAERADVSLFAAWHSRFAAAVNTVKAMLKNQTIQSVVVSWKEDVRKWHPGQEWIWQAGGMGVFDPGINGLSILTEIMPQSMWLKSSKLFFPENRMAPIAAQLDMTAENDIPIHIEFDWRTRSAEEWRIVVISNHSTVDLLDGGAALQVDGQVQELTSQHEYRAVYRRFAQLIGQGQKDVDLRPLKITADAFLIGERRQVEPFIDNVT